MANNCQLSQECLTDPSIGQASLPNVPGLCKIHCHSYDFYMLKSFT